LFKSWKGIGLLVLGIIILVLGLSVFAHSSGYQAIMVMAGLFMAIGGFFAGFEPLPPGGESVGFGDCTICGKTNLGVATLRGVNYCGSCYNTGAAQAYFDGMDKQNRESERERSQPQSEESALAQPRVTKETIREREVIQREIVKIRCRHCGVLFEEKAINAVGLEPSVGFLHDFSKIYSIIAPLLGVSLFRILNEIGVNQTAGSMVNSAYAWLLTLNPIVVIILGIIVFFAGKLAKWVGIIMVIVGLILLALPYLLHIV
jgi:hypothetical protein